MPAPTVPLRRRSVPAAGVVLLWTLLLLGALQTAGLRAAGSAVPAASGRGASSSSGHAADPAPARAGPADPAPLRGGVLPAAVLARPGLEPPAAGDSARERAEAGHPARSPFAPPPVVLTELAARAQQPVTGSAVAPARTAAARSAAAILASAPTRGPPSGTLTRNPFAPPTVVLVEAAAAAVPDTATPAAAPVGTGPTTTPALPTGTVSSATAGLDGQDAARRLLALGSQGGDVQVVQQLLVEHGIPIAVDGIYGPHTAAAITAFQGQHQLLVDGIAGPQTLGALSP